MISDRNQSNTPIFILLGFSEYPDLQILLLLIFLTIYVISVVGNLGMITIIIMKPKLHTQMYFFLKHLSFVDFCYSTPITPKLLENLVAQDKTISIPNCFTQFFFFALCVLTETSILAVMAYDHFVAICNPLLYFAIMSQKFCALLMAAAFSWGIFFSLVYNASLLLSFCGTNIIDNFLCEYSGILSASCSDKYVSEMILFILANFNMMSTLIIICTSYVFIFITVMKMHSVRARHKTFSTCASHLTAVGIFYGTVFFLYCIPKTKSSWFTLKLGSVFYTVVIPMLNPLIYSLRNNDVKEILRNLISWK
ncbi:olfactory receptor 5D18-like [Macrotis lagotis]|uniref:olfactory receptor 5D18-like n=1 Tax=Macrotis lagotis TaxID=92651 RepID=UPI003D68B0FD